MDARVKTGIPGLDELLGGGLPAGGTYVVVGGSGTGKSILSFEFLYRGALDYNEPGVYVTLEEDKDRLLANMGLFGWDAAAMQAQGKLRIVPYTRSVMGDVEATLEKGMMAGDHERIGRMRQYLTVDSLYREIEQNCRATGARRVVIDSLTVLTLMADTQLVSRMQLLWLLEKLKKLNITTIATLEEGIGYWHDLTFLADGIIYLSMREKAGIFERGLLIGKMRGTSHDAGIRPFRITDKGITVYPNEVIVK
ncbi:MAG: ATPase domain-containing protein [Candidatus Altiarchaeota archaeon]